MEEDVEKPKLHYLTLENNLVLLFDANMFKSGVYFFCNRVTGLVINW